MGQIKIRGQININRDSNGKVTFDEVSIDVTESVFFTNQDPQEAHWPYWDPNAKSPDFCDNQVGAAPSPNSSQCTAPTPPPEKKPPYPFTKTYTCKLHQGEQGTIHVYAQLAPGTTALPQAKVNTPLPAPVQVVVGGKSPYDITGQLFQITDSAGNVSNPASGIVPGLQLIPDQTNDGGITITGTPTLAGTYQFAFTVVDDMGGKLQQVQYSIKVV
jgi:hypothetical protein